MNKRGNPLDTMNIDFNNIIRELKRRRVFRVAAVYSGFAFIIFQIIDATFDTLGIPTWLGKYTIIALVLGFPIAVGLGWAFDITDNGVVRTKDKPIEHDSRKPFVGNISLSIVASIAIILALWGWMQALEVSSEGYQSIAVLPFDNYMGDATQDYFVDGMTEAIIAELATLEGLKVISRTSVMRFRGTEKPLTDIAAELGVDAIVEGSVLKAGNEVRITAQLIDGLSDEHLWSNSYVKNLDQVLSLQKDVASAIATQIKWTFKPEEAQYFQQEDVVNSEAYELYLKGRDHRLKESYKDLKQAKKYFEAAIALDSSIYQAYTALPALLFMLHGPSDRGSPQSLRVKAAIDRALEIAPEAPETQIGLALYRQIYQLDISGAHQAFEKAIEARPGDAEFRREYGLFLNRLGLREDALVQLEISRASDPLSFLSLRDLGMVHLRLGHAEQAVDLLNRSDDLIAGEGRAIGTYRAMALLLMNKPDQAHKIYEKMNRHFTYGSRGDFIASRRSGHGSNVMQTVDSLIQAKNFKGDESPYRQGVLYGISGDIDKAVYFFEKLVAMESPSLMGVIEDPAWDPIRHRPEYIQGMQDMGFPQPLPESFSDMLGRLYGPPPDSPIAPV